jgi:hypothetical protein
MLYEGTVLSRICCRIGAAGRFGATSSGRIGISAVSSAPDTARILARGTGTTLGRDATGADQSAIVDRRAERRLASAREITPRFSKSSPFSHTELWERDEASLPILAKLGGLFRW